MRNLTLAKLTLAMGIVLAAGSALRAQQESDPEAKKILDAVSAKYRSHDYVRAGFSYTYDDPSGSAGETQEGTLYVQPGGSKYRVQVAGQEMISDGTTSWVYLPEVGEVQISDVSATSGELNPAQLFTLHEEGFKYLLKGSATVAGKAVHLIDLVPLESSPYSKIEVAVEKNTHLLRRVKVFDKNGNHYIYQIKSITFDPGIETGFFTFNASEHPGVEVVDLR